MSTKDEYEALIVKESRTPGYREAFFARSDNNQEK